MLRSIAAALAVLVVSACVSSIESAYDEHARSECDRESAASERGACYDRVEQSRRDRR
jgi:hypothetical protein